MVGNSIGLSDSRVEKFWSLIDQRGPDECWPWTGRRWPAGYGAFGLATREPVGAHRIAFALANGVALARGRKSHVRHKCDNPPCCNPAHLVIGTPRENVMDAVQRGRWIRRTPNVAAAGVRSRLITDEMIREGAAALPTKQLTEVAKKYGVNRNTLQSAVWSARHGRNRSHVLA